MKAYRVHSVEMSDSIGITGAHTRGQAIACAFRSANDAGYMLPWTSFRAVREPKYDSVASALRRAHLKVEYADLLLNTKAPGAGQEGRTSE